MTQNISTHQPHPLAYALVMLGCVMGMIGFILAMYSFVPFFYRASGAQYFPIGSLMSVAGIIIAKATLLYDRKKSGLSLEEYQNAMRS